MRNCWRNCARAGVSLAVPRGGWGACYAGGILCGLDRDLRPGPGRRQSLLLQVFARASGGAGLSFSRGALTPALRGSVWCRSAEYPADPGRRQSLLLEVFDQGPGGGGGLSLLPLGEGGPQGRMRGAGCRSYRLVCAEPKTGPRKARRANTKRRAGSFAVKSAPTGLRLRSWGNDSASWPPSHLPPGPRQSVAPRHSAC